MSKLTVLLAILFAGALTAAGTRALAAQTITMDYSAPSVLTQPNDMSSPNQGEKSAKDYIIGLKGPNDYCKTLKVAARDEMSALSYAYNYCPNCTTIQNLTGQYNQGEAPWEMTPKAETFCLAK